jgi:hypothetical protein
MNKSFSKIRHIQEANMKLEKRLISEKRNRTSPLLEEKSMEREAEMKVEKLVDRADVEQELENILANLSDEEKENLMQLANMSPMEIHNQIENEIENQEHNVDVDSEMSESVNKTEKEKIADIMNGIAQSNIAAFGGVPLAIALGGVFGTFAGGLAISWGATAVLYGLAKLLSEKK